MTTTTATTASTAPVTTPATTTTSSNTATQSTPVNGSALLAQLGAGSGVDTTTLAQNLVEAERAPQKALIDKKINQCEAKISGFAAMSYVLSNVKDAFSALSDETSFNGITAKSTNTTAFDVTTAAGAAVADHQISVLSVAKPQRSLTSGFAANNTPINGGSAFDLSFVSGGTTKTLNIPASATTPMGVVDAINANSATWGISAQLVNTGGTNPYKILLTGQSGAANSFTLSAGSSVSDFLVDPTYTNNVAAPGSSPLQSASDASAVIDGVSITRATNTIDNVIKGVTFDLYTPTDTTATVSMTRDTSSLKDKLTTLVTAYNDAHSMFGVVTDPKSTVDTYGNTLVGDSTVRTVSDQLRNMFTGTSSTPGSNMSQLWQIGISIDQNGTMQLDQTKLDTALSTKYDDVVTMMTGNLNNQSVYSVRPNGIAGDAAKKLANMVSTTGLIATQSKAATDTETKYKADLDKLETRLQMLLDRYTKQFTAMNSFVGQTNSLKSSLKSTFASMSGTSSSN